MVNPLETLHKSLLQNNYDVPEDYNSFRETLTAKGDEGYQNRYTLWKSLRDNNYDVPDNYDDFRDSLFAPAGYKPTAEEMAGFQSTINSAGRVAANPTQSYDRKAKLMQQRQGLNAPQRINLGESNNLTPTEQRFNLETGEMEQGYMTGAGNEYNSKAIADMEQREIDKAQRDERYRQTLPGQLNDAYAERDRLNAELAKFQGQWVDQDGRVHYANRGDDESVASLEAALRQNQQRITALEAERDDDGGTQFWRGFIDAAMNPSVQTFGLTDFNDMMQLMRIKNKVDNAQAAGKQAQLTPAEQQLMESTYLNNYAQSAFGENRGFMYRAGGISMQALPFIAEFMTTGGMSAISQKGAELGARAAEKLALEGLKKTVVRNLGVLAGDVAAGWAMANTTGIFRTAGDVMQRNIGQVAIDDNGNLGFEGGKSLGRSVYEAEVANTLEYYTEKLGEHLKLGKRLAKGAEKMGLSRLSKAVNYLSGNKWLEAGGIQDYPSEVVEEEANLLLNAALVGDNKFTGSDDPKSVINKNTQLDIWGGMLFSIGLMQAPRLANTAYNAAGYYAYKKNVDISDGNAAIVFGRDNWDMIKEQIDNCNNEQLPALLESVVNGDMKPEQKTATMNYAGNLLKMRGYNMGMMAGTKDEEESTRPEAVASQAVNQGYQAGRQAQMPDEMKMYVDEAGAARENLSQYGQEFTNMVTSQDPVETLSYLMNNRDFYDDEQIAAAADFYQKTARAQGVMDAAVDKVDIQVEQANAEVRSNTHQGTGSVVMAKGANDADYYIIGGDIVTDGNGMTSLVGTGGAVVVKDPITGEVSVKSPQELMVYSIQNADELIQQNETTLRQQLMQQADDEITFGSPANEVFDMEDTVTLQDGEGGMIQGQIVSLPNAVDGVFVIQTNDGRALQMTADDMNRRIVEHNGMQVERVAQAQQPAGTVTEPAAAIQQPTEQTGNNAPENIPAQGNNAGGNIPNQPQSGQNVQKAGGEASTNNDAGANEPSALSRIPVRMDSYGKPVMNKKNKPILDWHKASVEDAAAALIETTGGDKLMARDTATDMVKNAEEGLVHIRKQKPKGEDPIEIAESRVEIRRQEQEQQAIIKHWKDVNQLIQQQMRDESEARQAAIEAAKSEEERQREAEIKRQQDAIAQQRRMEEIEKDRKERTRPYAPLARAKREMAGDSFASSLLENVEPQTLAEWVSSQLRPHSILWNDEKIGEHKVTGLQSELGLSRNDLGRIGKLLATTKEGGKPFAEIVDEIHEGLPDAMKEQYNDQDVRNTLIALFGEGNADRMMHLTEENRIEQAREAMAEQARRDEELEMEAWEDFYHLTAEERETFEDFMQQPPLAIEQEIIDKIIAEHEQNYTSPAVDGQLVSGRATDQVEGGEGQVQQAGETKGDGNYAAEDAEVYEDVGGEPAPVGDNVAGGTPGVDSDSQGRRYVDLRANLKYFLNTIGVDDDIMVDRMSNYEVDQLIAMIEDWEAYNGDYGQVLEETKNILSRKRKPSKVVDQEYDDAKAKVDAAQAKSNEAFEPIEQYIEGLQAKYGTENVESEGAIPTPSVDEPRFNANRQALIDAYRSGDAAAITAAAQAIQQYVDEGLDAVGDTNMRVVDIAEDYEGNDPETLADIYIIRTFWDRYLDDDVDKEYIRTGLKPDMRQSEQLKPTDLRDAVRVESPEIGVAEANARARALSEKEADHLMQRMEDSAVDDPKISLTPESWANTFGLSNSLKTPIGNVKMGEGQYQKFFDKSRSAEFGMAVLTLQDPDIVLIEPSQAKEGQKTERPYSYIFIKTFIRDGQKMKYFASVTVQRDNMEVSVSSHIMKPARVKERLTTLERLYTKETLLPNSSEWHLAEQQDAVPDLLPTQENNVTSEGKDTNNSSNIQENQQKSTPYSSFEELAADTQETVTDPAMQKALRKIVDKQFVHGTSNHRSDPRGFEYVFVYMASGTTRAERGMLQPWESQDLVEYNDDNPTATWIDEKEQRVYFIKYNPPGTAYSWDFIIAGYKEMPKAIGTTSSPEQIAEQEGKVDTNPTEGQKEAGNYQKGHIKVDGYDITIENPKGSVRSGIDSKGNSWQSTMHNTYGYIRGTEGVDGDHIDVFLSDNPTSGSVFVVDQINPDTKEFDEHKVMYGFANMDEAREAYLSNYTEGWQGLGNITEVSREDFKKWVESSHRKTKPFAEYKSIKKAEAKPQRTKQAKPKKEHKRIVSDDQMEELRKKLLEKFNNMQSGIDVERMLLGAMYAVGKIERGVTKFADYAREMVDEIGDSIRPYLKAFYNAVRDMPEAAEYRDLMDTPDYVAAFDVDNFDKQVKVPDAITKAEQVVRNNKAKKQVKKIEKEVKQKIQQGDLFAGDLFGAQEAAVAQQPTQQPKQEEKKLKTAWWKDPNRPQSLDPSDYKTYTTDEAKAYFAQFVAPADEKGKVFPDFTKWAHPNLAYITAAAWDGAVIPMEDLRIIPEIAEAQSALRSGKLVISDEELEKQALRLLDSEHGSAVYNERGKVADYTGAVKQERKAFFVIGRPAGGKSSVFADPLSRDHGARIIDADVVKPWLEGYDGGNGAGYVQDASSDVMERALEIAAERGDNMVIPKIGSGSVAEMAAALRLAGYDVQLLYNDVSQESSIMRAASRFAETGRYLSLEYLTSIKGKPTEFFSKFAKETIGDYLDERTEEELQNIRRRLERLHRELYGSGEGLRVLRSTERGGEETSDGTVQNTLGSRELHNGGSGVSLLLDDQIFSYAEWKSNDVAFGEKPKEIWNSKSGKPMPGKKEVKNNESKQEVSRKPESASQGAGQASGAAERTGTERSPEPNRAERSGSGHSVENHQRVVDGAKQTRSGSINPAARENGNARNAVSPASNKNRRNNAGERGKDYAPTSPKARFNANVEAIKLMRQLVDDGVEAPTKEQMAVLRQYSGWGGLGTYFNDESSAENKILRDLLDDEEYNTATLSIKTAYFTPAYIIDSMWDIAEAMGFKGGNVLEGSAGIGNIIGQMPKKLSSKSNIEAVEIDKISGNILKLLYPDAKVNIQGFQDTIVRNGSVDLAITNVPFAADLSVIDKVDKDLSRRFRTLHDFCIAKNIRKLREGGIGIFISTSGTLDKSNDLRAWITDEGQADVVGAFRLNNETFGGTTATSDIIVVRKRVGNKKSPNAIDISASTPMRVGTYTDKWGDSHQVSMTVNDYFKEHPEMMAGEMAFGYEKGDTYRPGSYGLYPAEGKNQEKMLAKFAKDMAKAKEATEIPQPTEQVAVPNQLTMVKEGRMLVDDNGRLCVSQYGEAVPLNLNVNKVKGYTKEQCFKDYQDVQKAVDDVLQQQLSDPDDAALKPKLDALNKAYDRFVKRYGYLHKNTAIAFLRNDIDFPTFQELEKYSETKDMKGKVTVTTKKSPIFTQRVLGFKTEPKPKTIKDALIASIFKTNSIDLEWITDKLNEVAAPPNGENWTTEDVRKGILVSRLGFENPSTGQLEVRHMYLSGNVREKLAIAEAYNTDGKYAANVEELRKVVPMDIPAHLIDFTLGSSWIPNELYIDYLRSEFGLTGDIKLTHIQGTWVFSTNSKWSLERSETNKAKGVYSQKFRTNILGTDLVVAALNNRPYKVSKQESIGHGAEKTTRTIVDQEATSACNVRIDEIKDSFKQYIRKRVQEDTDLARRIEKIYNDKFNALVPLRIDDEMLPEKFEDANMNISLYDHQKRGVLRGVTSPTMLAHEVGTGKSFTLISTAMEMRRLGTAKKPMIVVQNATVAQMTADAKLLYPNAKVLSLSEKDRDAEGRRAFYAKIRFNDWDMIIIPQSTLDMIPDSPQRELQFIQEQLDEKRHVIELAKAANMDKREIGRLERELEKKEREYGDTYLENDPANNSQLEAPKKGKKRDAKREAASLDKAETKAREKLDRAVDDVQYFDDLGVDAILVDEAHGYKHLGFETTLGRSVKGVDPSYSKKCAGLYNKTRAVFEKAGWKNVVFATGTPISNTAAEIWTFMKYLMPADVMKANDIYYFDDFVHNFGSINQMLEFKTNGKFNEVTRFAAYVNRPELMRIWMQVADIVRTEEVGEVKSKVPEKENGKDQDVFLPQSPSLVSIMAAVRAELERFENMDGKEKRENSSIPLTMYGIAKRAAIDPRLVDASAPDEPKSKTNAAVKEIVKDLETTKRYKGTVAVFCDNQNRKGANGGIEFNIFDDMKDKLVKLGVPEAQIAIIKSSMSITAKQKIFDKVNTGDVRVILGSTQTLGTGVNIQERLHLLIHMDAPDRPMDYTQRNGRIERQGNLHKEWGLPIRILRFGVEDSLDVTAYQRLKTKSGFIDSIMNGKSALANNQTDRTIEEEEEGLFDNPVAVLSGSQFALKKNQAERQLRKMQGKYNAWEADQIYVSSQLRSNESWIKSRRDAIAENEQELARMREMFPGGKVKTITVQGVAIDMTKDDGAKKLGEVIKEKINDPVNATVKKLRENEIYNDETQKYTIELDGHKVNFEITISRASEWDYNTNKMRTVVHKTTSYKSPDLRIEDGTMMPTSKSIREHLDNILEQYVSGDAYTDAIDAAKVSIERVTAESAQLKEREGQPFQFTEELKQAEKQVEEYTELMKKEMQEKEAKYAEQAKEAGENGGFDLKKAEESEDDTLYSADEDWDEDLLNRDTESTSSQDLLLSLSQETNDYERNESIDELSRRIAAGETRIVRLGEEMERGRRTLCHRIGCVLGSQFLARAEGTDGTLGTTVYQGTLEASRQSTEEKLQVKADVLSWAKRNGYYFDEEEVKKNSLDGKMFASGAESNVYRTKDGEKVIKFMVVSDYYGNSPLLKRLDDLALYNALLSDPLDIIGFSENKRGQLNVVAEQNYVEGKTLLQQALSENNNEYDEAYDSANVTIDAYLTEVLGLERWEDDNGFDEIFTKDGILYKDIHGGNVIVDKEGNYHIIDGQIEYEADRLPKERMAGFRLEDSRELTERQGQPMFRGQEQFAEGQTFPIWKTEQVSNYDVLDRLTSYSTELMPDEYASEQALLDAVRNQYPEYFATIEDGKVKMESWQHVMKGAAVAQQHTGQKGTESYVERKTRKAIDAVNYLAGLMGLDVEVKTTTDGLKGKKARAKGFFNPKTGKIVLVLPNNVNQSDLINTLLHEGVAHFGLRKMFGRDFATFLDNVYNNVSPEVKRRIDAAMKRNSWSRAVATEEYLARLAERTDFENAVNSGWWRRIKDFFMNMLAKAGVHLTEPLTDNELRYILWRSYDNLLHPDSRRNIFDTAKEITMQQRLGINRYARERERLQRTGRIDTSRIAAVAAESPAADTTGIVAAEEELLDRSEYTDEIWEIINKAMNDGTLMLAPNGKPSNLRDQLQWAQVRTKAFKDWFGDWENNPENASKVVDENGEPKVMYHKTNLDRVNKGEPFWIFYEDSHFGTKGQANDRVRSDEGAKMYEVFLNIRNPQRRNDADEDYLEEKDMTMSEYWQQMADRSKSQGHDGIVYLNEYEDKQHPADSWIAFKPNQIKSATDNSGDFSTEDDDIRYSIRTKEAPKKTGIGYKVFYLHDGQLYPPMVANPNGEGTPVGMWLDADDAPVIGKSKTGRDKVKAGGKGTQGGSGQLAHRPGWHLGEIPYALQFNRGEKVDNPLGIKSQKGDVIKVGKYFPGDFVWAEVEYADDKNYQEEAESYGYNEAGNFQHSLAGLPHIPVDGSYKYRTNANPATDPWIITGAMRVNRILTRAEVDELVKKAGREPQQIQDGDIVTDEVVAELNEEIQAMKEADEMGLLYRDDDAWVDDVASEVYEKAVATDAVKMQENWQDSMVSLKIIQDAIAQETGKVATGAEDAYRFENRMHGRAKNMSEQYDWRFYRPMLKAFNDLCKKLNFKQDDGMDYLISKSGLERNVYYAFRDGAKAKLTDDIKQERETLEKDYAKKRISEADYLTRKQELEELERTGVDEFMQKVRDMYAYQHAKEGYDNGTISYTEYLTIIETVIRSQLKRKTPKRDEDGNIVSDNYYDDHQQDYSGLTETFAKEMYDDAQKVKKAAQRTIDPQERRALWRMYDEQMRNAYITARQVAEDMVFVAEDGDAKTASDELWEKINAATKETLKQSYESGLIDRTNYNKVRDMFNWYIPLRGWEEDKASDVYTYMGRDNVFSPAVKKTWGRKSKAENPLAYIGNIAVSTILSGHRNLMKQHFLNYVMNNPTSLVSISESWYENIAPDGESPVWILRTADTAGKSGDEIAQIVNDFNDEMRQKQSEGKAMPVRGRLRLDVNATKGQKSEHVVEVQRAGHTYQLYINGNPKAAQALNGSAARAVSRISDTWLGKKITGVNRSMAAFFTSKNPAFVVSNLSRDLNMAGASVAINEGKEYNARFIANVAKVLTPRFATGDVGRLGLRGLVGKGRGVTGLMPKLMAKWKDGKLNEADETERLFKEFMDEGGETGFVNMLSIDSFKEKMQKEIAEMNGSSLLGSRKGRVKETTIHKGLRMLGDTFEFYNRCAEDATRFIVYMTSRQMGKTLEESIADAKDVTLNFNRKGTGGMGNAEVRDLFIFVNPAIQALANMYRMAKGHPLKFGTVTAGFVAMGALMPIINQWLLNMFGDDDDKQAYWNLPPWVRKNNLVMWIPFTNNFLTIPLAQEFRVFYGVGEMMSSAIMDHPVDKWGLEVFSSVADLVPINPTGNGGNLMVDFAPTMVQPLMQVGENVDFTGKPIWRENQGNKYAPMYTKAYISTPTWMVKVSESLNDVTGGNEGKKGAVERYMPFWGDYINNPAVWNHLLQGYYGGMYNTIAKTFDVGVTAVSGKLPKIYQTPIVNRFLNRPVERDNAGALGEDYYNLKEQRDALQYELRTWKKKAADGEDGAQEHVDEILSSDEWKRAEVISHYEKIMKDLKAGERAATDKETKAQIKESISLYKQQMMEELNALDSGKAPLDAALEAYDKAKTFAEKNKLRLRIERLTMRDKASKPVKGKNADIEKALSYTSDDDSRNTNKYYLTLATADNIRDDARIMAAKAKIKPYKDEYKRLNNNGNQAEAAQYREQYLKYFIAQQRIDQLSRAMNANKNLLGKGNDKNILRLIDAQRSQMIKAIEGIE